MLVTFAFLEGYLGSYLPWLYVDSLWWTAFGLLGNAAFSSRFVVQWLMSEKHKKVVVPPVFWHLSFWGSVVNLLYAIHLDKLPLILGFAFLPFIYFRNLVLLTRERNCGKKAVYIPVDKENQPHRSKKEALAQD
jgi:lipid-A-disaccharide synthase-like uncharacterized protein